MKEKYTILPKREYSLGLIVAEGGLFHIGYADGWTGYKSDENKLIDFLLIQKVPREDMYDGISQYLEGYKTGQWS